jgi:hypothetical protein
VKTFGQQTAGHGNRIPTVASAGFGSEPNALAAIFSPIRRTVSSAKLLSPVRGMKITFSAASIEYLERQASGITVICARY